MKYTKNGKIITLPCSGVNITVDGVTISNPTEQQLIDAGYVEYVAPEPTVYTPSYKELVEGYIRDQYSISEEQAIQRQKDTKLDEWVEYYEYCEACKARAKEETTTNTEEQ